MPAASSRVFALAVFMSTLPACDRITTVSPSDPGVFHTGDPILGRVAYEGVCAGCHVARDGFDIAFFGFGAQRVLDQAMVRVDSATALDIVAYIGSLDVPSSHSNVRPFQPGGELLAGDVEFAERTFGMDGVPEDLSTGDLLALDPISLPVAVAFPAWSEQESNLHWLPETPLDEGVEGYEGGEVVEALEAYYEGRSGDALIEAVALLRSAERDSDSEAAPCVASPLTRLDPVRCFETRRWIASLGGQFLLRSGEEGRFARTVHDSWWDVGNAARLSLRTEQPVDDALQSWVRWMYLGWAFEPARHSSFYLASGLHQAQLPRHAAFHALRSMVARGKNSRSPYEDVLNVARYAPDGWVYGAAAFGYRHLLARIEDKDKPKGDALETAVYHTLLSYQVAAGRVSSPDARRVLREYRDQILERLD